MKPEGRRRIRIFLLFLSFLLLMPVSYAASTLNKEHAHHWEYVVTRVPRSYYVDVNKNNVSFPQKDMLVFFTKVYDRDKKVQMIMQNTARIQNKQIFMRYEYVRIIDSKLKKTYNLTAVGKWKKAAKNSPAMLSLNYLVHRYRHKPMV